MMKVRLTKTEAGYATRDGRFTVEPTTVGTGVTGWAGGRGWSNGHREWLVTDTTGKARLSQHGGAQAVVDALWRARDLIGAVETREAGER